jgi:beta-mannanase
MKQLYLPNILLSLMALIACGGSNDEPEPNPEPTPTVTAPTVTSTSPANGAADVAVGNVSVSVTYDKDINVASDASLQPVVSGGTLSGSASRSGKVLSFNINCPNYETKVSVTLPKGLVGVKGALADEYSFSFTTVKKPESPNASIAAAPVAATTDAAKKLYTFFRENYGQKVVSSVMANVAWNISLAEKVKTLTGKYPAMNCYDFIHIQVPDGNGWIDYSDTKPVTEWAQAGGIVQLMWHFNVPKSETTTVEKNGSGVTCSPSETTFKASNALKQGTWENKYFYEQMDRVIAVLLKLQDAGIAATWRPFHEAAGNAIAKQQASWTKAWFWWGYDGPETFKQLWQAMFDYFKQKGVNNLIWIWTTQNYNGNSSNYNQDNNWYPGDNYCDMVARDLYGWTAQQNVQEFTEIQTTYPNKMIVLGECGWDSSDKTGKPQGLISDCWNLGAKWGHFMVWYDGNAGNSTSTMVADAWWKDAMQNANVITRDQVQL